MATPIKATVVLEDILKDEIDSCIKSFNSHMCNKDWVYKNRTEGVDCVFQWKVPVHNTYPQFVIDKVKEILREYGWLVFSATYEVDVDYPNEQTVYFNVGVNNE